MADRIFATAGDWAVGADELQRMPFRRRTRRAGPYRQAVPFVRSTRDILARCCVRRAWEPRQRVCCSPGYRTPSTSGKPLSPARRRLLGHLLRPPNDPAARPRVRHPPPFRRDLGGRRWGGRSPELLELTRIALANPADYVDENGRVKDIGELTRDEAAAIQERIVDYEKVGRGKDARKVEHIRYRFYDKKAALVELGRHHGLFVDKVQHTNMVAWEAAVQAVAEARLRKQRENEQQREHDRIVH
jgi:hypothetical protein